MVGLVIVSHSRQLAEAACRLAKSVGQGQAPIAFAGGAGPGHADLGTDATDIMEAIQKVDSGAGVVVLMDLGSAVLSAKLAAEMLADSVSGIVLCPAPLVEGAVAAAVAIPAGADAAGVAGEARNALAAKTREMDDEPEAKAETTADAEDRDSQPPADALRIRFTMADPNGMHTRPAAAFVKAVAGLDCRAGVRNARLGGPFFNGRSLNRIALANIGPGEVTEAAFWGPDAEPALAAVKALITGPYQGREVDAVPETPAPAAEEKPGTPASSVLSALSPGVAAGVLFVPPDAASPPEPVPVADSEAEVRRLDQAVAAVRADLEAMAARPEAGSGDQAAVFQAQVLLLDDADLQEKTRADIRRAARDAAGAYRARMSALADQYRSLSSPYMRERAADVAGVMERVLEALAGTGRDASQWPEVVAWADEAGPALLSRWRPGQLRGILTREGGATSHLAILARAMNIPAIAGYELPGDARAGDRVALDANRLEVVVKPTPEREADFAARRKDWEEGLRRDLADSAGPAATRDGVRVSVYANVGDVPSVTAAVRQHAEGIGLLRTEFLFLDRRLAPDEDEQTESLARLLRPLAGLPAVVRILDAGGDKPMPWLDLPRENNPFLGVRGVRLAMARPDVFQTQVRAILRAGAAAGTGELSVMAPMVATMEEIVFCRRGLEAAHRELAAAGTPHCWPVRFGIMVETPAAALRAEPLAAAVDFFSIGTNDLTQYVLCAERGAKALRRLSDAMHPAVLTAIGLVAAGAARHGTEVAVCGEMAADPVAALALLGLGIRHLSMNAAAIGGVKRAVRRADSRELAEAVRKALATETAEAAREAFAAARRNES